MSGARLSEVQGVALASLAAGGQPRDAPMATLRALWRRGLIEDATIGPSRWKITRAGSNALKHGRVMESRREVGT